MMGTRARGGNVTTTRFLLGSEGACASIAYVVRSERTRLHGIRRFEVYIYHIAVSCDRAVLELACPAMVAAYRWRAYFLPCVPLAQLMAILAPLDLLEQ